jgi:hypothetical protein
MTGRLTRSFLPAAALAIASASLSAQAAPAPAAKPPQAAPAAAAPAATAPAADAPAPAAAVVTPAPVVAAPAPAAPKPAVARVRISPGPGPQRWNVVDGLHKQTVASYLNKESLTPEPALSVKAKPVPKSQTKRTRAILEDAVFTPLNHRKSTAKYRKYP